MKICVSGCTVGDGLAILGICIFGAVAFLALFTDFFDKN